MMGSGKTYWAERLKKKFKIPAYDLDALVEMMEEKTIAEMFAEDGEDFFRKAETKMLRMFREKKQFILSCGGGTPCFNENISWMNKNGVTIWLNEPIDVIAPRLYAQKEERPLIKDLENADISSFLHSKLAEREPFYKQATYTLCGDQLTEDAFAKIIKQHA
jgi:shikimate kinase